MNENFCLRRSLSEVFGLVAYLNSIKLHASFESWWMDGWIWDHIVQHTIFISCCVAHSFVHIRIYFGPWTSQLEHWNTAHGSTIDLSIPFHFAPWILSYGLFLARKMAMTLFSYKMTYIHAYKDIYVSIRESTRNQILNK